MQPEEFQSSFGELQEREDKWGKYLTFLPRVLPPAVLFDPELILTQV